MRHLRHLFHIGLDRQGDLHLRRRSADEVRRAGECRRLRPQLVVLACRGEQPRWRNGLHRRRFLLLTEQVRGDRRGFLMTLRRPPLVRPF